MLFGLRILLVTGNNSTLALDIEGPFVADSALSASGTFGAGFERQVWRCVERSLGTRFLRMPKAYLNDSLLVS